MRYRAPSTALFACALAVLCSEARAYFATGGQFSQMCQRDQITAQAYAAGVVDGFVARRAEVVMPVSACLPDDVKPSQIVSVACAFAEGNPDQHDFPASYLIMAAVDLQWPCEDGQ